MDNNEELNNEQIDFTKFKDSPLFAKSNEDYQKWLKARKKKRKLARLKLTMISRKKRKQYYEIIKNKIKNLTK